VTQRRAARKWLGLENMRMSRGERLRADLFMYCHTVLPSGAGRTPRATTASNGPPLRTFRTVTYSVWSKRAGLRAFCATSHQSSTAAPQIPTDANGLHAARSRSVLLKRNWLRTGAHRASPRKCQACRKPSSNSSVHKKVSAAAESSQLLARLILGRMPAPVNSAWYAFDAYCL
jgi:hypothetical protein